jgi:hypothetical protein
MSMCISKNKGTIGYMDTADKNKEELTKIKMRNDCDESLMKREIVIEGAETMSMDILHISD